VSIRTFVRDLTAKHPALHLLVNNAGVMATPLGWTADGFETQMGTNHLGHLPPDHAAARYAAGLGTRAGRGGGQPRS
jgi:NAD(P)-dependent dehydrogenase (short-subunit alcohol dehydrogenase family)